MRAVVRNVPRVCADFDQLKAALPGHRYRWIDIEDEADVIGDVDVETFPTLLVAHQGVVLFAGPVLPRLTDAQRLLEAQVERWNSGNHRPVSGLPDDQFWPTRSWPARCEAQSIMAKSESASSVWAPGMCQRSTQSMNSSAGMGFGDEIALGFVAMQVGE